MEMILQAYQPNSQLNLKTLNWCQHFSVNKAAERTAKDVRCIHNPSGTTLINLPLVRHH